MGELVYKAGRGTETQTIILQFDISRYSSISLQADTIPAGYDLNYINAFFKSFYRICWQVEALNILEPA